MHPSAATSQALHLLSSDGYWVDFFGDAVGGGSLARLIDTLKLPWMDAQTAAMGALNALSLTENEIGAPYSSLDFIQALSKLDFDRLVFLIKSSISPPFCVGERALVLHAKVAEAATQALHSILEDRRPFCTFFVFFLSS